MEPSWVRSRYPGGKSKRALVEGAQSCLGWGGGVTYHVQVKLWSQNKLLSRTSINQNNNKTTI